MKNKILITIFTMTLFSFTPMTHDLRISHKASQNMAEQVVLALRQSSPETYTALAPTLEDFKTVMQSNEFIYGNTLEEAQKYFAIDYEEKILPSMEKAFYALVADGKKRGIEWNTITLVSWETLDLIEAPLVSAPFIIAFESKGKIYRIEFSKALFINDHWCVSQYVKLV